MTVNNGYALFRWHYEVHCRPPPLMKFQMHGSADSHLDVLCGPLPATEPLRTISTWPQIWRTALQEVSPSITPSRKIWEAKGGLTMDIYFFFKFTYAVVNRRGSKQAFVCCLTIVLGPFNNVSGSFHDTPCFTPYILFFIFRPTRVLEGEYFFLQSSVSSNT